MDSQQQHDDELLLSSLFAYITSDAPSKNENDICKFNSLVKEADYHSIQNKCVNGLTLLQHTAKNGSINFTQSLLDLNIDPNVKIRENGKTALLLAAEFGQWQVIDLFSKHTNTSDNRSTRQSFDSTDYLSEIPINFHVLTKDNESILHILLKRPKLPELVFRKRQMTPNVTNEERKNTKRQWKKLNTGYLRSLQILIFNEEIRFDSSFINIKDQFGNTALHYAALNWPQSIIRRLLEIGACPIVQNAFQESPLQYIQPDTLERFMDEYCLEADECGESDVDEEDDELDMQPNVLDDYDPNYMTNIRQSSITFNYNFLSPYNKHAGTYGNEDQILDEENQEPKHVVFSEMNVLAEVSKSKEHRHLLIHPVIKSYIWIKWKLINQFFHRDIRLRLNLVFCLTWYIFSNYGGHDYNQKCLFEPAVDLATFCFNVHGISLVKKDTPTAALEDNYFDTFQNNSDSEIEDTSQFTAANRQSFQIPHNTRFCKDEKFAFSNPENTHQQNFHHGCNYASTWYVTFVVQALVQIFLIFRGARKTLQKKINIKHSSFTTMTQSTVTLILLFWADLINFTLLIVVLWKSEVILWLIVAVLLFTTALNELNQFASMKIKYFSSPGNYIDLTEVVFIAILLLVPNSYLVDPMTFTSVDVSKKLCEIEGLDIDEENNCSIKRGIAAVLIVMSWTRLLHGLAKHPSLEKFNIYFMMFYKVVWTFLKILMWYILCIIAFGLGFYIMLHNDIGNAKLEVKDSLLVYKFFDSPWTSLFRAFMMFVGEIDYNNIPIGISYGMRHGNISTIFAYLFLLAFIFLISVVLVNLLNGLAVSDTGEIMRESVILHEASRIDTISYFETITLSNLAWIDALGKLSPWLDTLLQKYIACVHRGIFIFHTHISPSSSKLTLPLQSYHEDMEHEKSNSDCSISPCIRKTKLECKRYGCHDILDEARGILIRRQMDVLKKKETKRKS